MNVMEAIDKIKELEERIESLYRAMEIIDGDYDDSHKKHVYNLKNIKSEHVDELNKLKSRLEKTQLTNVRGVE